MTWSLTPPDGCLELVHRIEPILDPVSCTAGDTNIEYAHSVLLLQVRLVAKSVLGNLPCCVFTPRAFCCGAGGFDFLYCSAAAGDGARPW
jgi:hypothetical protein